MQNLFDKIIDGLGPAGDKLRLARDSAYATKFGKREKAKRQKILQAIDDNERITAEALIKVTNLQTEDIETHIADMIWYRWIKALPFPAPDGSKQYVSTDRGKRQLANPGSVDHENF